MYTYAVCAYTHIHRERERERRYEINKDDVIIRKNFCEEEKRVITYETVIRAKQFNDTLIHGLILFVILLQR